MLTRSLFLMSAFSIIMTKICSVDLHNDAANDDKGDDNSMMIGSLLG